MKYNTLVKKLKYVLVSALILSSSSTAFAYEWVFVGGYKGGGDNLYSFTDILGTTGEINAGAGLYLGAGINMDITSDLKLKTLIGSASNGITLTNVFSGQSSNLDWSHIPLDFLVYQQTDKLIYGAGLTIHFNPELKGTGSLASQSISYDTALGLIGELDYRFTPRFYVGLNYTLISYKGNDGSTASGSGLGLNLGYAFGE